jgi:hypothetical protein
METELLDCYFCDEPYPNVWFMISSYNGIMICNSCENFGIFMNKTINMVNIIDCPVCYQNKMGIELPNCNHIICIDCCKSIYFGYNSNDSQRPKHYKEQKEPPDFPYTVNDDIENDDGRQKLDEYMEWESENYNYENSLEEILEKRDKLKLNRPDWMNTDLFIDYENQYIQYWIDTIKIENRFDNYIENKQKNIKNRCCPLCRS